MASFKKVGCRFYLF